MVDIVTNNNNSDFEKKRTDISPEATCILKIELLRKGVRIKSHILDKLGEYKENNYGYNNPNFSDDKNLLLKLPTEIILPFGIVVSFRYRADSPYDILLSKDGRALLYLDDKPIVPLKFSPRPKFWRKKTSTKIPMKQIGSVYGLSALTFFILNYCEYFRKGMECQFCSLDSTMTKLATVQKVKRAHAVAETILEARHENYLFTNFIGGSLFDTNKEFKKYVYLLKKCREIIQWDTMKGYVVCMPPEDISLLQELRETGITGVKFNLELAKIQTFNKICPGKAIFGYDKIIEQLIAAVDIFGKGNVFSNLIIGLETPKAIIERTRILGENGIGVVPHVLHVDNWAKIEDSLRVGKSGILEIYREIDKIYKKHGLRPWLNLESLRGCLSWEFYLNIIQ